MKTMRPPPVHARRGLHSPMVKFLGHVCGSTTSFIAFALMSLLPVLIVQYLSKISPSVAANLAPVEHWVFYGDLFLFCYHLLAGAMLFVAETLILLIREIKEI